MSGGSSRLAHERNYFLPEPLTVIPSCICLQVCLSIDGLYNRCKLAAFTATLPTLAQLDVIGNHVSDLALIVREARQHPSASAGASRDMHRSNSAVAAPTTPTPATAIPSH